MGLSFLIPEKPISLHSVPGDVLAGSPIRRERVLKEDGGPWAVPRQSIVAECLPKRSSISSLSDPLGISKKREIQ